MSVVNHTCISVRAAGANITCSDVVKPGYGATTELGTETAFFNFRSIYLGPGVNVTVTGDRALVLVSRSTAIYDTPIVVQPGTLGVRNCSLSA